MMVKKLFPILVLVLLELLGDTGYTQSLERMVFASGGSISSWNSTTVLSQTFGQAFFQTSTITNGIFLTQGFQQVDTLPGVVGLSTPRIKINYKVYPNPATDIIQVNLDSELQVAINLEVLVYDLHGRIVKSDFPMVRLNRGRTESFRLDIQQLSSGSYFLVLDAVDKGPIFMEQFIKR